MKNYHYFQSETIMHNRRIKTAVLLVTIAFISVVLILIS